MYKYLIYENDTLVIDSQEEFGEDGIFDMDDVAWDLASEYIFCNLGEPDDPRFCISVWEIEPEEENDEEYNTY